MFRKQYVWGCNLSRANSHTKQCREVRLYFNGTYSPNTIWKYNFEVWKQTWTPLYGQRAWNIWCSSRVCYKSFYYSKIYPLKLLAKSSFLKKKICILTFDYLGSWSSRIISLIICNISNYSGPRFDRNMLLFLLSIWLPEIITD